MKRILCMAVLVFALAGCASTRNTINRLQGDIAYFQDKLAEYAIVLEGEHATKAGKVLNDAKDLLAKAESASLIGDKIAEKKYLSALVDIMDLLPKKESN